MEGADNESAAEHVILAAPDGCFAADSFSTQNGVAVGDSETGESTATGDEFEIAGEAEDLKEVADTLLDSYHKWGKVPVPDRPLISTLRQVKRKRLAKVSNHVDKALNQVQRRLRMDIPMSADNLSTLAYVAARYVAIAVSDNETHNETGERKGPAAGKIKVPGWLHRLSLEVDNLRAEIGRLESMRKAPSPRHSRLWSRFGLKDTVQLETLLEERKLRLKALAERIRRYKQQDEFRRMNELFAWNEKAFYRELRQNEKRTGTEQEVAAQIPDKGEIENFWGGLLSTPAPFKKSGWFTRISAECKDRIQSQEEPRITMKMLCDHLSRLPLWKAAGVDKVHGYWWKTQLPCTRICA